MLLIYMHVTIDPPPVRPVNHCFTTCTGRTSRTSRVKAFTGRIRSTVLDKDGYSASKSGWDAKNWISSLRDIECCMGQASKIIFHEKQGQ